MILPDANLLLYAYDSTSVFHEKSRQWWEQCLSENETVGLCPTVLYAFVRIATHPRVYDQPMTVVVATGHVEDWLKRKVSRFVPVEPVDIEVSFELLHQAGTGGDLTTDAQIAAVSMRLGATIHSADTDFLRFPGVKVVNPLKP